MTACDAIQYSDQMVCTACDLGRDMNDPDPPACESQAQEPIESAPVDEDTLHRLRSIGGL